MVFFTGCRDDNSCKPANTPSFLLVPPQMESQSLYAVEGVLDVGGTECRYSNSIFGLLRCWLAVVVRATNLQGMSKLCAPP